MKRKAAATKTKKNRAAVSRSRKTAKRTSKGSTRGFEIKGLVVFAIGLIALCGFFGLNVGFVGIYLAKFLSYLFGVGSFVVDIVIMVLGYRLITQHRGLDYTLSLFGYVLLFGALLAIWHHFRIPAGEEIMPDSLPKGGGLVGGAILFLLRKFFGATGAIIVLFLGALASLLVSTGWSLAPGLLKTQKKVEKGAQVTKKAVARGAAATANVTGTVVKEAAQEAASAARDVGSRAEERWQEHMERQRLEREARERQREEQRRLRAQRREQARNSSFYNQDEDAHFAELNDSVNKPAAQAETKQEQLVTPENNAEQATVVMPKITISGIGKVKAEEKIEAVDSFLETPPANRRWLGTMTGTNAAKYGVATAFTKPSVAVAGAAATTVGTAGATDGAEDEQQVASINKEEKAEQVATNDKVTTNGEEATRNDVASDNEVVTSNADATDSEEDTTNDEAATDDEVAAEIEDVTAVDVDDNDIAEEDADVVTSEDVSDNDGVRNTDVVSDNDDDSNDDDGRYDSSDEVAESQVNDSAMNGHTTVPHTAPVVAPSPSPMRKHPVPMPSYSEISPIASAQSVLEGNSLDAKRRAEGVAQEAKYAAVAKLVQPYVLPKVAESLDEHPKPYNAQLEEEIEDKAQTLQQTLTDFKVKAKILNACHGPAVTRYEIEPAPGVKVSKITNLADDIALRLAATSVRIEQIPGKSAIGIEVPNAKLESVALREVLDNPKFAAAKSKLTVGLGMDISGEAIFADLAKMPHLLVAGATGSGKSVCINTLITSILFKAKPDEVKFILVDPKMVELSNYNGIPHLMVPVVTDAKKAASVLNWSVQEMEKRYATFAEEGVRNMASYNKKFPDAKMPAIVIIIDELADLMMVAPHDVEDAICRLAQKARAAGIHMVLATQRPSVDVITGIIKANIPSRISFAVSSQIDSRTILDRSGAEKLLGKGDMLFYPVGAPKPRRVQGAFVSDDEVEKLLDFIRSQGQEMEPNEEIEAFTEAELAEDEAEEEGKSVKVKKTDALLERAVEHVMMTKKASSSSIQRRFGIGYTRAARLVDTMEALHIVGPNNGSKPREILMNSEQANQAVAKLRETES